MGVNNSLSGSARPVVELIMSWLLVQRPNHYVTKLHFRAVQQFNFLYVMNNINKGTRTNNVALLTIIKTKCTKTKIMTIQYSQKCYFQFLSIAIIYTLCDTATATCCIRKFAFIFYEHKFSPKLQYLEPNWKVTNHLNNIWHGHKVNKVGHSFFLCQLNMRIKLAHWVSWTRTLILHECGTCTCTWI